MEWLESILSTMVSLRVFSIDLDIIYSSPDYDKYLSLIKKTSTHLQYFTVDGFVSGFHCWKQLHGEWIACDETEYP
jgi:hypothetical protein